MSGIRRPYSVDELVDGDAERLLDRIVVRVTDDGRQRTLLAEGVLGELDHLGVLGRAGEDDDHAVDDGLLRLDVLVIHDAVAVAVDRLLLLGARRAHVDDALVLEHGLDGPLVLEAGDGLEARGRVLVRLAAESAVSWSTLIACERTMSMVSPCFTRKSRPVARSTWKAIAFSPGFRSAGMLTARLLPAPIASPVT